MPFWALKLLAGLLVSLAAFVGGVAVERKIAAGTLSKTEAAYAKQVAAAQLATQQAEERERAKESAAAAAAATAQQEHEARVEALQAANAKLVSDGDSLRRRYAALAASASTASQNPAPGPEPDGGTSACWNLVGLYDQAAQSSSSDAERLAEQVRGLIGYIDSLKPFME